jgi:uncharacterized membrane protein YgdD (TMEM256/DUF423 family)
MRKQAASCAVACGVGANGVTSWEGRRVELGQEVPESALKHCHLSHTLALFALATFFLQYWGLDSRPTS